MIRLIAAMGQNREIGVNNDLPWRLSDDLKIFKNATLHSTIVMGRNTFESIGKPLPKRLNIVLATNPEFNPHGCLIARTADTKDFAQFFDGRDLNIIGGAQIYRQFMPYATEMLITKVHGEFADADAFFPEFNEDEWESRIVYQHEKDERNSHDFTCFAYSRTLPNLI